MINWFSNVKPLNAVFLVIGFLIISFVLVHLFAIFGIFIAVGFPLWWILFPQLTTCLYCRGTTIGKKCKACGEIVEKKVSPPKNFRSVVLNTLTILLVSIISAGTVYLEYQGLKVHFFDDETQEIVEFIIPETKQYKIGEIFSLDLEIDTNDAFVNAIQSDLNFDPEIVEIVKISLEKSFASVFIQNEINNEKGYFRITGGLPNPGFIGEKGHFATVYLKAKKAGLLEVAFLPTSLVLANDGKGSNILKSYPTISYLIKPEYLSDSEQEMQDSMYSSNVLGIESSEDQTLFFEEDEQNVLGINDIELNEENVKEAINIGKMLFELDSKIVDIIKSIFNIFQQSEISL